MSGRWRGAVAGALVVLTCAVFAPALDADFVQIDDPAYVTENPAVRNGLSGPALREIATRDTASMWVPLTMLSHLADVALWGLDPRGHHLTSVLIHGLNAGLLFLLLHALTGAPWRSAAAALLFALHPLRVESVAWVAERKDVLSGLLAILTIDAYRRWVRSPTVRLQALTCGLFALGLLAKPMLVTLPVLLLLLDEWPLERTDVPWRRRLLEKVPLALVAAAAATATMLIVGRTGGMVSFQILPLGARVENAIVSYARYLAATCWPAGLAVYYPLPAAWPSVTVGGAALALAALAWAAIVSRRRAPFLLTGLGWFIVALAPVIGIAQAGMQAMADRFTYLPAMGLGMAIVWAAGDLLARVPRLRSAGALCAAGLLVALVGCTRAQLAHWQSSRTLFEHTLSVTGDNWFVHNVYGDALLAEGAPAEAATQYERALALEPRIPKAHTNLGAIRFAEGDVEAATRHFVDAVRLDPNADDAAANLVAALEAGGLEHADAAGAVATLRRGTAAARQDRARRGGDAYYSRLASHLMSQHTGTVGRCRAAAAAAPAFDLFFTIAPDGLVASATSSPPSDLGACVASGLSGSRLPPPPFAPFHARLAMNLSG